jgi:hypothetical protein
MVCWWSCIVRNRPPIGKKEIEFLHVSYNVAYNVLSFAIKLNLIDWERRQPLQLKVAKIFGPHGFDTYYVQ